MSDIEEFYNTEHIYKDHSECLKALDNNPDTKQVVYEHTEKFSDTGYKIFSHKIGYHGDMVYGIKVDIQFENTEWMERYVNMPVDGIYFKIRFGCYPIDCDTVKYTMNKTDNILTVFSVYSSICYPILAIPYYSIYIELGADKNFFRIKDINIRSNYICLKTLDRRYIANKSYCITVKDPDQVDKDTTYKAIIIKKGVIYLDEDNNNKVINCINGKIPLNEEAKVK
jgi:hypothetical protein